MEREFNAGEPEWMDRPQPASKELAADLENLRKLNAWFGGHSLIRHFLTRWFRGRKKVRVLDLCTGSADIPRMMVEWGRDHGVVFEIDAVEFQPGTVEIARTLCARYPEIRIVEADALRFESDEPYDAGFCSLALHHFSNIDAARLLTVLRDAVRGPVLAADLERSWLTSFGIWMLTSTLFRQPMTRNDARVSARRAFSFAEFAELAEVAGWNRCLQARFLFGRQALWLDADPEIPLSGATSFLAISPAAP